MDPDPRTGQRAGITLDEPRSFVDIVSTTIDGAFMPTNPSPHLDPLLKPSSIAVIGASIRKGSFGNTLWNNLEASRSKRSIFPVNPRYESIEGTKCYPDLFSLPQPVDLVAVGVSDDHLESTVEQIIRSKSGAAVLFGRAYEPHRHGVLPKVQRLAALAREANLPICGANCMGFINYMDGLTLCGSPLPPLGDAGRIGFISHSGSTWSGFVANQRQLFFNYAISAGQEISTSTSNYIDFLLEQPETKVIGCILETVRDPEMFLAALEKADKRGIPVVILKLGRSERGKQLALAHSNAVAGSDTAYSAIFERRNAVRVTTPDELADTLELFACPRRPESCGIGIVTDSGGERELIVDIASDNSVPLAELDSNSITDLEVSLDPGMFPTNPVDSYGDGRTMLDVALKIIAADSNVGIVALSTNLVHGRPYLEESVLVMEELFAKTDKPVLVFGNLHSTVSREGAARLRAKGIPVLMGVLTALLAMKHLSDWQTKRDTSLPPATRKGKIEERPVELQNMLSRSKLALSPQDAFSLLSSFEIPTAESQFISTREGAGAAARKIGFPLVLKTASPEILHKSDEHGVALNLMDIDDIERAYDKIAAKCGPHMQVQAQAAAGVELLLGMTNDAPFGPMLTIGLGGIFTEILEDAITVEPDIDRVGAAAALRRLKGWRLLNGYRGRPPANIGSAAELIERFARLCTAIGTSFAAIDVNPVIITSNGAIAIDALFIPKAPQL